MAILAPILRSPRLLLPSVWVHANCLGSGASWVCSARRRSNQRRAPKNPGGRRRYGGYRPDEPPRKEYEDSGRDGVRFFAACHPFLQQILAEELSSEVIGAYDVVPGKAGVHFKGRTLGTGYAACLWLRTGIRVEVVLAEAQLPTNREAGDTIYDFTRQCASWPELLKSGQTISVKANVWGCTNISNNQLAVRRVRDAICDAMRDAGYPRPPPPGPRSEHFRDVKGVADLPLYASIFRDRITLYRDLSGDSLHRRGYRFMMHKAVLNEATAAGMLYTAGWDRILEENPDAIFADPMCGSGTLLVEAGLMARNIAPGSFRKKWPFQQWPDYNKGYWEKLLYAADEAVNRRWKGHLLGCEISDKAFQMARIVSHGAKIRDWTKLENANCANWVARPVPDLVVTNPPWGIRLTDDKVKNGLEQSWKDLGSFLRTNCRGKDAFALCGDPELSRSIGMRANRKFPVVVGGVDCRLLKYEVFPPLKADNDDSGDETSEVTV